MSIVCYQRAIHLKPDYAMAYLNLGICLIDKNLDDEAIGCHLTALEITKDIPESFVNLAGLCHRKGRLVDVVKYCRNALKSDQFRWTQQQEAQFYMLLGSALYCLGNFDQGLWCVRRFAEIGNDHEASAHILFVVNYHPDLSTEAIYQEYQAWEARWAAPLRPLIEIHANVRDPNKRLRIGYVSPDFRNHSVRHFLEPVLEAHNRGAVELFAYAELKTEDEWTARYRDLMDHWRSMRGLSDEALAERIRADGIDILVDLAGLVQYNY